MEDVLALYHELYDEARPVICFDESSKALRGHERNLLPAEPGAVARVDHRYERNGKQRLHITTEPLIGWVAVEVMEKRRTTEWIDRMVELADVHYPDADCIRVVMDQLNTHKPAAFYDFFPPEQAKAYLDRFEFHYTPKRGSIVTIRLIGQLTGSLLLTMLGSSYASSTQLRLKRTYRFRLEATLRVRVLIRAFTLDEGFEL